MIMILQPKDFLQLCNGQVEPSVELGCTNTSTSAYPASFAAVLRYKEV
jgi:hypothetical protein